MKYISESHNLRMKHFRHFQPS